MHLSMHNASPASYPSVPLVESWSSFRFLAFNFSYVKRILALEDKKQNWHYAEVLHLETGLQDTSLQSQQCQEILNRTSLVLNREWGKVNIEI